MRSWVRRGARVTVVAGMFTSFNVSADAYQRVMVEVQGRPVLVAESAETVAGALAAARRPLRAGAVRAAASGRVLVPGADPPRITVNGQPASLFTRVRSEDQVWVTDGVDSLEPVVERQETGPTPSFPVVETTLWRRGRPRVEHVRAGEMSGEVVSRTVLEVERPPQPENDKVVALTFDDGPDPRWTPAVMQILREEGVLATFCVLASAGRSFPELVRAEHDAGHAHCDHTVDHVNLGRRSHGEVLAQVAGGAEFLASVDGVRPELFRAPFGVLSPTVLEVTGSLGLRVLGWTVDSADYLKPPPHVMVARMMSQMHPGAVVLMHDGGGDRAGTVAALRPLIQALKAQGYRFSTPTRQPLVPPAPPPPTDPDCPAPAPAADPCPLVGR